MFECSVCLCNLPIEHMYATKCGHPFHLGCIKKAVQHCQCCPNCRCPLGNFDYFQLFLSASIDKKSATTTTTTTTNTSTALKAFIAAAIRKSRTTATATAIRKSVKTTAAAAAAPAPAPAPPIRTFVNTSANTRLNYFVYNVPSYRARYPLTPFTESNSTSSAYSTYV